MPDVPMSDPGAEPGDARAGEAGIETLEWESLPDGCWRLTSPGFAMNSGLVVGSRRAALIDTGSGPREAAAILRAVRRITDVDLVVVNTHAHGDHFLGNDYFRAHGVGDFYAGNLAISHMEATEAEQRALVLALEPEMGAGAGAHTAIHMPTHALGSSPYELNLGDRFITLQQVGSAHSPGDVTVRAGRVLFAGDVIEQGGPPNFGDSRPVQWLRLLEELASGEAIDTVFVPGHGSPVGRDFVQRQTGEMREAIARCRILAASLPAGREPSDSELSVLPYGAEESRFMYGRLVATSP